jgi:hypothetical protein
VQCYVDVACPLHCLFFEFTASDNPFGIFKLFLTEMLEGIFCVNQYSDKPAVSFIILSILYNHSEWNMLCLRRSNKSLYNKKKILSCFPQIILFQNTNHYSFNKNIKKIST